MVKYLLLLFSKITFTINFLFGSFVNEKKILKEILDSTEIVYFDVGTNYGIEINLLKNIFRSKKISVHAFEPNKNLKTTLQRKYPNIILNTVAVSNFNGVTDFYEEKITSQSSINSDISSPLTNIQDVYKTEVITLDEYISVNDIKKIDYLKIDVEGSDYKVLEGLKKSMLRIPIKLIKIEVMFLDQVGYEDNFKNILNFLDNHNFKIYAFPNIKHLNNKIYLLDVFFINKSLAKI